MSTIDHKIDKICDILGIDMAASHNPNRLELILKVVQEALQKQAEQAQQLQFIAGTVAGFREEIEEIEDRVNQIYEAVVIVPSQPTGVQVRESKGDNMAAPKKHSLSGGVDLQILPNGTVLYTAELTVIDPATGEPAVDADGNFIDPATKGPVVTPADMPPLNWVSSDTLLVLSPPDPPDPFNLTQIGTGGPTTDPVVGIVVTCSTTLVGASSPISGSADPVDIVPAPITPSNPTGFAVVESTPPSFKKK